MSGPSPAPAGGTQAGVSEAYWRGAAANRLLLQRCAHCGRVRHYPRPLCDSCHSFDAEEIELPRRGTVHSWTVTHHAFDPALAGDLPYVLVTVDIADGVRMLGRFSGDRPLRIGLPVEFDFVADPRGVPVPHFVAAP